jgi:methionyl-tRNA synthetase
MNNKYYITTAIAYTSGKPHIGNTYDIVVADAIARFKRLQGYDVYFQTGSDEHGEKIEIKAKDAGVTPQEYVDKYAGIIKGIWDKMNTSYDKFVRTTDPIHEEAVQKIFKVMYEKGDIYKGEYKGLYCTPCEAFWTESQLVDGKCPDCGRDVHEASEEAYFFKLSNYQDKLVEYINSHPDFIQPESRKNEMLKNFIEPGLQDLCVSRTSFTWGIPVTFDDKHVVYVWLDALTNYITNIGYSPDGSTEEFNKWWPANLHVIGKDIIRFHTIYWPCFLWSLGLEIPEQVFGHPWVLTGNEKMSKSRGNVIYADDLVDLFGVDAVRYYLLHETSFNNDGNLTYELIIERYNSDLANTLGNLVNRTISMAKKYFDGIVPEQGELNDIDNDLISCVLDSAKKAEECINNLHVADSLDNVIDIFRRSNKYIDETTPWILAKEENKDRLKTVIYNLLEAIRIGASVLTPFLTETADKIFEQLNTDIRDYDSIFTFGKLESGKELNDPTPLFVRLDKEEKLKEIEELNK